jgi:hypothetical protein
MKMRQHDVAKPVYCRADRASAAICERQSALFFVYGKRRVMALAPKHDPEKACPGPDPGWMPLFMREQHAKAKCRIKLKIISL